MARELDLTESALRRWVTQYAIDHGSNPTGALTTEEKAELRTLRREVRVLREERDILKKARQVQSVNATAVAVYQLAWHIPASCVDVS